MLESEDCDQRNSFGQSVRQRYVVLEIIGAGQRAHL